MTPYTSQPVIYIIDKKYEAKNYPLSGIKSWPEDDRPREKLLSMQN